MNTILGELVRPASPRRAGDLQYPLLSMTMHDGLIDQATRFKKRIASTDLSTYKVVEHGQLVVSFPIDEGVLDFQTLYDEAIVSPAYGVWDLIDPATVDRDYLKRALRGPISLSYYRQKLRGSTARRRSLPLPDFLGLPLHLPPIAEQRRIASVLDEADTIRAKRRAQLTHLNELPTALFLEAFGDPITSSKFQRHPIGQTARILTGNTPARSQQANFGDGIDWVKTNNLGGVHVAPASEQLTHLGQRRARIAPPESVLVACIAGSRKSIGKASIADREVAFNQQINAILPSPALDPIFLFSQIQAAPELVRGMSTGGMKGLVSKSKFESINVLVPPLATQKNFATKISALHAERDRVSRALEVDDELFAALQHKAFRGEL